MHPKRSVAGRPRTTWKSSEGMSAHVMDALTSPCRITMPVSGFTPDYDWMPVDHLDRRHSGDSDEWWGRAATGALAVRDVSPTTTTTFCGLAATFSGVDESFYSQQQQQQQPWTNNTATRCRSDSSTASHSFVVCLSYTCHVGTCE